MDNQMTTTFIPKKPISSAVDVPSGNPVSRPTGLLSTISVILFFVTIALSVGMYFWKSIETTQVAGLADSISKVEKTFEPELITKLQSLDRQLKDGNQLLASHTVVSPIFDMLEASTLKQVQFNKFDLAFDDVNGVQIKMSGVADGYQSIAQESDALGSNTFLKNVLFSNFFLNQKGKVSFDLSFGVRPDFVTFTKAPLSSVVPTAQTQSILSPVTSPASTTGTPATTTP